MMKDYKNMTHEELEMEMAEIVKKNYEKGAILLDRNYDIRKIRGMDFVSNIEDVDELIAIIRTMRYKPDLKKYCKGMTDKEPLVHPITYKYAWKEKVYDDFVTRDEFINRTGIFVTPQYYDYIYVVEWKEAKEKGKSLDDFIENYEENSGEVMEIQLNGTFKYIISDDYLSCIGDYEDVYDPNIYEIINCLARSHEHEYQTKCEIIEKYDAILDDCMKKLNQYKMLLTEPEGTMAS